MQLGELGIDRLAQRMKDLLRRLGLLVLGPVVDLLLQPEDAQARGDQTIELLAAGIAGLALEVVEHLAEPGDHARIDRVVLGQPPGRPGEVADPLGIDDHHLEARLAQQPGPAPLVAAAGLHHSLADAMLAQPRHQRGTPVGGNWRNDASCPDRIAAERPHATEDAVAPQQIVVHDGGDMQRQHRDQQPRQAMMRRPQGLEQGTVARHQVGQGDVAEPEDADAGRRAHQPAADRHGEQQHQQRPWASGASTACQCTTVAGSGGGGWRQRHSRRPTVSTSTTRPTHLCQA